MAAESACRYSSSWKAGRGERAKVAVAERRNAPPKPLLFSAQQQLTAKRARPLAKEIVNRKSQNSLRNWPRKSLQEFWKKSASLKKEAIWELKLPNLSTPKHKLASLSQSGPLMIWRGVARASKLSVLKSKEEIIGMVGEKKKSRLAIKFCSWIYIIT